MTEWRDTQSDPAPNEGKVIVFGGRHKAPRQSVADGDYWKYCRDTGFSQRVPTHWMHFPEPPQNGTNTVSAKRSAKDD